MIPTVVGLNMIIQNIGSIGELTPKPLPEMLRYFLDKGMKGAPGGGEHPNYVYIF